jgi:hypothetical protein
MMRGPHMDTIGGAVSQAYCGPLIQKDANISSSSDLVVWHFENMVIFQWPLS